VSRYDNVVLGGKRFREEIARRAQAKHAGQGNALAPALSRQVEPRRILELVAQEFGVGPENLTRRHSGPGRMVAIYLARKHTDGTLLEVGRMFRVHGSRVSHVVGLIDRGRHPDLRERIRKIQSRLQIDRWRASEPFRGWDDRGKSQESQCLTPIQLEVRRMGSEDWAADFETLSRMVARRTYSPGATPSRPSR